MRRFSIIFVLLFLSVPHTYARPSLRSIRENAQTTAADEAGWRMKFFTWNDFGLRVTYPESWREPLITTNDTYSLARLMPQDNTLGERKNYLLELTALTWDVGHQLTTDELEAFARKESPLRYNEYYVVSAEPTTLADLPAWDMRLSTMTGPREEIWVSAGRYVYTLGFRSRNDQYFEADHFFYEDYLASVKITPIQESGTDEELTKETEPMIFTDVGASHPYAEAISWAKDNDIVGGYPDGTFKPEQTVNRAELLKIILGSGNSTTTDTASVFSDVQHDAWYFPYVANGYTQGIIQGYTDGTFRPGQTINTAEALKMIYETLHINTNASNGPWYEKYFSHANTHNILYTDLDPAAPMKREDVVWILWKLTQIL